MSQWVTQQKVMEQTGLEYGAVCCWRAAGLIRALKIRGKWMYDIEAFNEELTQKANTETRIRTEPLLDRSIIDIDMYIKKVEQRTRKQPKYKPRGM